ncbi:MAG: NlpC/P60 family protein [Streptosporangiaceae bacterium]
MQRSSQSSESRSPWYHPTRLARHLGVGACVAGLVIALVPGGAVRAEPKPSIHDLRAKVEKLANKAEVVTERYNGQKLKLARARREARRTRQRAEDLRKRAEKARAQVGRIAAAQYKAGSVSPAVQMLSSVDSPQDLVDRAATFGQLSRQNSAKLRELRDELARSKQVAAEARHRAAKVKKITSDLGAKKRRIKHLLGESQQELAHLKALERQRQQRIEERQQERASRSATTATAATTDPSSASSGPSVPGSGKGAAAAQAALSKIGTPYVWGAAGPDSFDCSGLVVWSYKQVGISLPHYTGALWTAGPHVSRSELQPGDLVFYYPDHHHVGIYVGNGKMINAPYTGTTVQVEPVDGGGDYSGAVRVA